MVGLFPSGEQGGARETGKTLPEVIRQLIVDLHAEAPFMSWREIAEICYIRYGRRPHHKHVKRIATSGPPPSLQARRFHPWHQIPDPAERKLAAIRLHAEGWSITSIAQYLATSRHTIYDTLQRWVEEGVAGLDAKPKTNKGVRKTTLRVRNEIRKLQENPLLGEYRVHTALLRGIEVKNANRLETHFRSPQLDLWRLSATEWLLALRRPEPVTWKKQSKIAPLAKQLLLPEFGATG